MANDVTYECTKCGAQDHDRGEFQPPQALNCWKCGAGQGIELNKMLITRIGMFPVKYEEGK